MGKIKLGQVESGHVCSEQFIQTRSCWNRSIEVGTGQLKERIHIKLKTWERLDYYPITLILFKRFPTFPDRVSVSKICTSGDLHRAIRGPASHHPRTCITPSADRHHTICGPAKEHPRTCIAPSRDLPHPIRTCIRPSGPASLKK